MSDASILSVLNTTSTNGTTGYMDITAKGDYVCIVAPGIHTADREVAALSVSGDKSECKKVAGHAPQLFGSVSFWFPFSARRLSLLSPKQIRIRITERLQGTPMSRFFAPDDDSPRTCSTLFKWPNIFRFALQPL